MTSPYMPLYIADYLADTSHLTAEEHGAYLLLIMTYWQRGKALPADPERLANIARVSNERWTSVQRTLNEFFVHVDGTLQHKRIEHELGKVRRRMEADGRRLPASEWTKLRAEIFARDNYTCTYCDAQNLPLQCDHIIPVALGGNHSDENLVTACEPCNRAKGAQVVTIEEFRARRRALR